MLARTGPSAFPSPKKSSLLCCDKKPEPACRYFIWRRPPVVINVGQHEAAAVIDKIQTDYAGNFGERAIPVVQKEDIPLEAIPGGIRADQLVNRVPSTFVALRRGGVPRRF